MVTELGPRLSQYHTLQFVGASGTVSSPFGFLLLLLAFFGNLLPNYSNEVMEGFVHIERRVLGTGFYVRNIVFGRHFFSLFPGDFPQVHQINLVGHKDHRE